VGVASIETSAAGDAECGHMQHPGIFMQTILSVLSRKIASLSNDKNKPNKGSVFYFDIPALNEKSWKTVLFISHGGYAKYHPVCKNTDILHLAKCPPKALKSRLFLPPFTPPTLGNPSRTPI
jgi:hypothetical protein